MNKNEGYKTNRIRCIDGQLVKGTDSVELTQEEGVIFNGLPEDVKKSVMDLLESRENLKTLDESQQHRFKIDTLNPFRNAVKAFVGGATA